MAKVLFYGDPHGEFRPLLKAVESTRPSFVVLLGDMGISDATAILCDVLIREVDVLWIHGNHDCDQIQLYDNLFSGILCNNFLHGQVRTISDVRVAGLGGNFQGKIWRPTVQDTHIDCIFKDRYSYLKTIPKRNRWRDGLPLKRRGAIWPEDYKALAEEKTDILVLHEAPSCHQHGYEVLDELAARMEAKLVVHGHHHSDYDGKTKDGIRVRGVGLATPWLFDTDSFEKP